MFKILSHKRNSNQNGIETPSDPSHNGKHQEIKEQQMLARMQGNGLYTLLVGM
jgi:hypothetical protein